MTLLARDFELVRKLVREHAGIVLEKGKEYLAESRLTAVAREEGCGSLQELVARLRAERWNGLHRKVVEAMTTNETSFFRDLRCFDALRKRVLPDLIAERADRRRLAIWCAGCASGQEAYSVAMLLREHFPGLAQWEVTLFATDLSRHVLERARAGRYKSLEVSRGLPEALLAKYFRRQGAEWQIAEELRAAVEFRELNLAEPWPIAGEMDLVLMRNVLIYLDADTRRKVFERLLRVLSPSGYLVLGTAEAAIRTHEAFERVEVGRAALYRPRQRDPLA
jgi:chemotaxis protein methyltransferase CheR